MIVLGIGVRSIRKEAKAFCEPCFDLNCKDPSCNYEHVWLTNGSQSIYEEATTHMEMDNSVLKVFRFRRLFLSKAFGYAHFDTLLYKELANCWEYNKQALGSSPDRRLFAWFVQEPCICGYKWGTMNIRLDSHQIFEDVILHSKRRSPESIYESFGRSFNSTCMSRNSTHALWIGTRVERVNEIWFCWIMSFDVMRWNQLARRRRASE